MKQFNNQFATQKLRINEDEVKFVIKNGNIFDKVITPGKFIENGLITDTGDYFVTDRNTFERLEDLMQSNGFISDEQTDEENGGDYSYEVQSDYMKNRRDPEYYQKQYKKHGKSDYSKRRELDEEGSVTGTGATAESGKGEQYATPKAFKKKNESKDVEPKLAAGKAEVYMKNKWGWKESPSIPNRPSKGGYIYKQLFEELNENYARFKKETKIKTESQQIHAAMRLAEKKLTEANRILEYTGQLRRELSETKYSLHTERVMERMVKNIVEAYKKIKQLK